MAVNSLNVKASLSSFTINDVESNLHNCTGTYSTYEILDSGETLDNIINYKFAITGLQDHIIDSVIFKVLLLNDLGELISNKKFGLSFYKDDILVDSLNNILVGSELTKTLIPVEFSIFPRLLETENECVFSLLVNNNSLESCYLGIQNIIISLYDVDYNVSISFSGPLTNRKINSITAASLNILKGSESVTFSKDPTNNFDSDTDTIEGRAYFRKDGIYVDGYLYGTVAGATGIKAGIVKIKDSFETFTDADTGETGIVAPTDSGVAASTLMVYNAIASVKAYTDALIDGIPAPSIELEDGTLEEIEEDYIFSNDFKKDGNKLYINWLEIE